MKIRFEILSLGHHGDQFVQECADKVVTNIPIGEEVKLHVFVSSLTPRTINLHHGSGPINARQVSKRDHIYSSNDI